MGMVWRSWDERLKRRVAIKQIRPGGTASGTDRRLLREAQATARLNHAAVVHVYDLVEEDGALWIVMELVEGKTLRRLIEEQGPLPVAQAVQLAREIADGLDEAHAHGILHRDLKVSNVMVTPAGHAKILDFGLAKAIAGEDAGGEESGDMESAISAPDVILGTYYAMSPEQVQGLPLDARSDLFSLGSLLYEVLTGEAPFRGETPAVTLARVLGFRPPPLPEVRVEVSWELSLLVEKLLEKDRLRRPQSAAAVSAALASLAETLHPSRQDAPPRLRAEDSTLAETVASPLLSPPGRERRPRGGEHRLLTILCCGIVGFDEASGEARSLELESVPDAMEVLHGLAREVCERFSGRLGTVLEDRLWIYFGHPQALEDDVERAVGAARELAARSAEIGPRLALRAAVHTGPALFVTRSGQERLVAGVTLDTATEIQNAAPARAVVVSAASRPFLARSCATKLLSTVQVPGSAEAIAVYRVLSAGAAPWQAESGPLTPLVARERELDLLADRFRLARAGNGQAVMLSGEAGIGKSRLVRALRERLAGEAPAWWTADGALATRSSPLAPVIGLLERHLLAADDPAQRLQRLREALARAGLPVAESVSLLAPLFSPRADGHRAAAGQSPETARKKTFEILVSLLAAAAERSPLALIVEDLHWVDASTLELLGLLLDEVPALPLFFVATFRPEIQAPWSHRSDLTQLSLSRLTDGETASLIDRVLAGNALADDVRRQILALADGVPLFVEELTKAFLESAWTGEPEEVPATLAASLAARLDRTGVGKEVAQTAAVLGRTFSFESLEAVSPLPAADLRKGLDRLIEAGLIHRRGAGRRAQYSFKHALLQEAAYTSLLSRDRQALHREAAQSLEARKETEPAEPGLLAHHWSHAVDPESPDPALVRKAVSYLLAAAEGVQRLGAYKESQTHLDAALRLVRALPAGTEREEHELAVQIRLLRSLRARKDRHGRRQSEIEAALDRARELCRTLGDPPETAEILFALWEEPLQRGQFLQSLPIAHEWLAWSQRSGRDPLFARGCLALNLFFLSRLFECLDHTELVLGSPATETSDGLLLGAGPQATAAHSSAWVLACLGLDREALARNALAERLAETLQDPHGRVIALSGVAVLHRLRHDWPALLDKSRELERLAGKLAIPYYRERGRQSAIWALAESGRIAEAGDEELAALLAPRDEATASEYVLAASIHLRQGRLDQAGSAVEAGLRSALEHHPISEIHLLRLQGELQAAAGDLAAAEVSLRRSWGRACQLFHVLEAERAASLLAPLLEAQERRPEAEELRLRVQALRREAAERARQILGGTDAP
jgi:DNA-binding transcriptional ArsR family regulator